MRSTVFAALFLFAAVDVSPEAPKAWKRETLFGRIVVDENPWGGFGQKTFALVTSETAYSYEQEYLAFASRDEFAAVERHAECPVEIVGVRVNRASRSWVVVEQVRALNVKPSINSER